jgi:hypothetical protein
MRKLATGMLLGFGAAMAGWWYYSKMEETMPQTDRGEVIFSNTPVAD